MRPVGTIPGIGGIKENEEGEIHLWCIVRTFINVPQYNNKKRMLDNSKKK
jgi:hypothetical protein